MFFDALVKGCDEGPVADSGADEIRQTNHHFH